MLRVEQWPASLTPVALDANEVPPRFRVNWRCPLCRVASTSGVPGNLVAVETVGFAGSVDQPVTLLVPCVKCRQTVALTYESLSQGAPTMYSWICPYAACGTTNTIGVIGAAPTVMRPEADPSH